MCTKVLFQKDYSTKRVTFAIHQDRENFSLESGCLQVIHFVFKWCSPTAFSGSWDKFHIFSSLSASSKKSYTFSRDTRRSANKQLLFFPSRPSLKVNICCYCQLLYILSAVKGNFFFLSSLFNLFSSWEEESREHSTEE